MLTPSQHAMGAQAMYHDFEPTGLRPYTYADETRAIRAQLIDEENDIRTCEIMADWVQLHQYHNRHDFADLPARVILDWAQMGRPPLPGHDEITFGMANEAIADAANGDFYSAESFMVCAAICEAMDSNYCKDIQPTPAYEALFEAIKTVVEMEGGDE